VSKKLNVLVTGSDAPGFASIISSLKITNKYNFKIIATDWKSNLKGKSFLSLNLLETISIGLSMLV